MPPKFLYFDLGNVLVDFDPNKMIRQVADVAGIEPARAQEVLFDQHLQSEYELGRVSTRQFYEAFCQRTATRPDFGAVVHAASDFFTLNLHVMPIVASLVHTRHRLGILSNTCECHWDFCARRFRIVREAFDVVVVSYKVGAAKPDAAIYQAAAQQAGVPPHEIFFVDDVAENVQGALDAGFDTVRYTSAIRLASDLRQRKVPLNC